MGERELAFGLELLANQQIAGVDICLPGQAEPIRATHDDYASLVRLVQSHPAIVLMPRLIPNQPPALTVAADSRPQARRPADVTILDRLRELNYPIRTKGRNAWKTSCPVCGGKDNRLAVALTDNGRWLVHCLAHRCPPPWIVGALGLDMRVLFPPVGQDRRSRETVGVGAQVGAGGPNVPLESIGPPPDFGPTRAGLLRLARERADDPFPLAERWVATQLGISRMTAWRAIRAAVAAGALVEVERRPSKYGRRTIFYRLGP